MTSYRTATVARLLTKDTSVRVVAPRDRWVKPSRLDVDEQVEREAGDSRFARRHEAIQQLFASVAPRHADGYSPGTRSGFVYVRRRELVARRLGALGGDLLDVGCGAGVFSGVADTLGFTYRGIDSSPEMIAEARRSHGDNDEEDFSVGRIENLDLAAESFDVVLALGVLEYVSEEDQGVAMDELRRVLRPGGTLIMSALNRTSPIWAMRSGREVARRLRAWCSDGAYVSRALETTFSSRGIRRLLTRSDLRLVEDYMYAFVVVPTAVYGRRPQFWSRAALRLERLSTTPLRALGLAHLVVATAPRAGQIGA